METIYLHDAGSAHLVIRTLPTLFNEEDVQKVAEDEGMRWSDLSWGTVTSLDIRF